MSSYHYIALNTKGETISGVLDAESERQAGSVLMSDGLRILEIKESESEDIGKGFKGLADSLMDLRSVSATEKVFFFRQLALMLRSGLSLTESLTIIQNILHGKICRVANIVNSEVQNGEKFSNAIAAQGKVFPEMARHMIRSAEATGQLDIVMERISDHIERRNEIKREAWTTLLYPGITLLIAIAMFVFLVTKVVPKFADFFARTGKPMPAQTKSLVDFSVFLGEWGLVIVLLLMMVAAIIVYLYSTVKGRFMIDSLLLKIPIVGSVITLSAMSQMGWGLSMLLRSGLTVVESMEIIKSLIGNAVIANDLVVARERILRGQDLGCSLQVEGITPLFRELASVGEKSGSLTTIMEEAGNYYETSLLAKNKVLSSLVEPMAILLIGGMVGYVYLAFFKAMFAVSGG